MKTSLKPIYVTCLCMLYELSVSNFFVAVVFAALCAGLLEKTLDSFKSIVIYRLYASVNWVIIGLDNDLWPV